MSKLKEIRQRDLAKPINSRVKTIFDYESTYWHYYNILLELYTTRFEWELPKEIIDEGGNIYLEWVLTTSGQALFFKDDVLDKYLVSGFAGTKLNWYGFPSEYTATLQNGYSKSGLNDSNAVRIYNSNVRTGEVIDIGLFADRLATCDLIVNMNLHAQKMPYIIKGTTQNKLSWEQMINKLDSYEPNIIISKELNIEDLEVLKTDAPFIADKVYDLKLKIWNEALSYVGLSCNLDKRERVTVGEQLNYNSDSDALLMTALAPRQEAAKKISEKFDIDCSVKVREDLQYRVDMMSREFYNNFMNTEISDIEEGESDG